MNVGLLMALLLAAPPSIRPDVRHEKLANGLEVYLVPDHSSPLVVVQIWVHAGSRDEREAKAGEDHGITGLSHFFEHLMFQGTARFPSYDDALTPLGAQNNAFTYQDATVFWAYTPKQHLELILDIEADRFRNMKVDFLHLEPEREVVKNERRQRTDSSPSEIAEERAVRNAFDQGGYRWGTIGWMSDLDSITLAEAQAYHKLHYQPRGATMIVAGDFEPAATLALIDKYWSSIPAGPEIVKPPQVGQAWVGPRTDYVVEDSPTTSVVWAYRAPAPGGPTQREYAALELVDWVLTAGKTGRLQKRLVLNDAPKVSELGASLFTLGDPWVYRWTADLLPGTSVGSVEAALDEEMRGIAQNGVSPDELTRAVAGLRTDVVHHILSNSDRAEGIGFALASTGDPFAQFARLEAYPTITQAELEAVAAKWLVPEVRSRVTVVSPARLTALADAWATEDARAGVGGVLRDAAAYFVAAETLRRNVAEADREERAVAMLAQRADVAKKTASKDEAAAIDKYLSEAESGTVQRRERLKVSRAEQAAQEQTLEAQRKKLAATLGDLEKKSAAEVANQPMTIAAKLLLAPWSEGIGIPVPPRAGANEQHLALQAIASWVCAARGLQKTAQDARAFVVGEGTRLRPSEGYARAAFELAYDTSIEGMPVKDLPLFTVRRTK